MLLGELLVSKNVLSEMKLLTYLEKAKNEGKMLGETLVEAGIITHAELEEYLKEQGYIRKQAQVFYTQEASDDGKENA